MAPPSDADHSTLFDLIKFQIHRRGTTENHHSHPQTVLVVVDFFNHATEIGKWAVNDTHFLTGLEHCLRPRLLHRFLHLIENLRRFLVGHRRPPIGRAAGEAKDTPDAPYPTPSKIG